MAMMIQKAYAKLNLTLDVTGKAGGYHLLDSVAVTIGLCDRVHLRKRRDGLCTVVTRGAEIPPERNNALRAAESFCRRFCTCGVDIVLEKNIPVGAGLGGSSADPAAVIAGMGRLFDVNDRLSLKQLADEAGSDEGFLFTGGIARIRGRGELVSPLPFRKMYFSVLPTVPVSTADCFAAFDALGICGAKRTERAAALLEKGDIAGAAAHFGNDLSAAAEKFAPVCEALGSVAACSPLGAGMTGSGGAVFGLFESRASALRATKKLGAAAIYAESVPPL